MIHFHGLYHHHPLGVRVDDHDIQKQQTKADQSCILHTFYREEPDGITIFTRHFSAFRLYCKNHGRNSIYEAFLIAALFRRQQYAEGKKSVMSKLFWM